MATINDIKFPLNNAQLELLKVFEFGLNESEEKELKKLLYDFTSRVLQERVDAEVDRGNWVKLKRAK